MSLPTSDISERWVRVTITLHHGRFDAGTDGATVAEWPPEPYRLFAALRAGAAGLRLTSGQAAEDAAVAALRSLESTPAPIICVSFAELESHEGFVPVIPDFRTTNPHALDIGKMNNRIKASSFPEITTSRGQRFYQRAFPAVPKVIFDLDATELSDDDIDWLRRAASEVPYFGRSTSPALITVSTPGPRQDPAKNTHAYIPGNGSRHLAVWAPGLVDALEDKHHALQQDLPMIGRALTTYAGYGRERGRKAQWLSFEHDNAPYRSLISARKDLIDLASSFGDDADVVLIANVANSYATGRLGLAASYFDEISAVEMSRALSERGWSIAGNGAWLEKRTWVRESAVFATATPVWLDTKNPQKARQEIIARARGWGDVPEVVVSHTPFLKGATRIADHHAWHVALKFNQAVAAAPLPHRLGQVDGVLMPLRPAERPPR
jgi:hypothetical protein